MSILADHEIEELCAYDRPMISPFVPEQVREVHGWQKIVSYGLSSFGYDARLGRQFKQPKVENSPLDPHRPVGMEPVPIIEGRKCLDIPPHGFLLGHTVETFQMPDDVMAICMGKSTYARLGLIVNVTPLEPGWRGQVTLELSNTTPRWLTVYPDQGICQFVFFRGARPRVTYADRGGKYQDQTGVTLARV